MLLLSMPADLACHSCACLPLMLHDAQLGLILLQACRALMWPLLLKELRPDCFCYINEELCLSARPLSASMRRCLGHCCFCSSSSGSQTEVLEGGPDVCAD
jgi:hypothetical protein